MVMLGFGNKTGSYQHCQGQTKNKANSAETRNVGFLPEVGINPAGCVVGLSLQKGPGGPQRGEDPDMERKDTQIGPRLSLDVACS